MAENKIWGLPCAVLPKKCPIRISRKSFFSQPFNKACSIWVHVIPSLVVSRRCRDSVPPSLPQQRWISFNFWGIPSLWTHPWNLQKIRGKSVLLMVYHHFPDEHHNCNKCCWYIHYFQADPILQRSPSGSLLPLLLARYQRFHAPHDGNLELWLRVGLPSIQTWPTCSNFSRVDSICHS